MKKIFLALLLSILYFTGYTQYFSFLDSDIVDVHKSKVAWCDFDSDGDLDFIINGCQSIFTFGNSYSGISIIYENIGDDFVVHDTLNFYENGALVLKDLNNDNVNDILSTGFISVGWSGTEAYSDIYLYSSDFDFEVSSDANLPGLYYGEAAAGDIDNDGDLDIVLFGRDTASISSIRTFIKTDFGYEIFELPYAENMSNVTKVEIFDIDNDGDNDVLFCGNNLSTTNIGFKIYKNNGNLNFELLESVITTTYAVNDFEIGDIDSDGWMDLITTGLISSYPNYIPNTNAFINTGSLLFEQVVDFTVPDVSGGDIAFGDINDDGQEDILITGTTLDNLAITKLFVNNNGIFNELMDIYITVPTLFGGSSSFADFDCDGDLDFLISGINSFDELLHTYIYENHLITKGEEKEQQNPTNLTTSFSAEGITFNWDPILTPTPHTYNLRVGTTPEGTDIMSPGANLTTGYMYSPGYGNMGFNTTYTIRDLNYGTYYWSVQSVNAAFQSSVFSSVEEINYSGVSVNVSNSGVFLSSNPITENSYLQILNHTNGVKSDLIVYSLDGKFITKETSSEDKIILNKNDYTQGIYFYQLVYSGKSYTGKFSVTY